MVNKSLARGALVGLLTSVAPAAAVAQTGALQTATGGQGEVAQLRAELAAARARIDEQERRLQALESRLVASPGSLSTTGAETAVAAAQGSASTASGDPATALAPPPLETVGEAPIDFDRAPAVAVLGDQGAVITRNGQLTIEGSLEYARADRNRALFRGIEIVESVLVGVFDINESRQDVVTAAAQLRYGLTDRLEVGVRLPAVYRNDASVLAPVAGSTGNDGAQTIDSSARGQGIGDLEASIRYQLTDARAGRPFLIGNLQVVAPTGSDPFAVRRDSTGRALEAATGAGFWGVSPSLTAILPTDPAVLFGTLGYTFNFAGDVNTVIPPVRVLRVDPGDSISASAGIGITLNQRTSFNLGYAHSWAFGTKTRTQLLEPAAGDDGIRNSTARDLQIGRLLFGVTYRLDDVSSLNWSVELGATDDATDLRTVLRIPLVLISGD